MCFQRLRQFPQHFGMTLGDFEQGAGGTGRLPAPLFPSLHRAFGDTEQRGKLCLTESDAMASLDHRRRRNRIDRPIATGFDIEDRLQKILTDIPLGVTCQQFFFTQWHYSFPSGFVVAHGLDLWITFSKKNRPRCARK